MCNVVKHQQTALAIEMLHKISQSTMDKNENLKEYYCAVLHACVIRCGCICVVHLGTSVRPLVSQSVS